MLKIIKNEILIDYELKKKLELICEFNNTTPTIYNGSIRKIDKTNITYIEPHRIIIKNCLFLVFNYSTDVYINNLSKSIKLTELKDYIKKMI